MDWVHETKSDLDRLACENARLTDALLLAEIERDFLIRKQEEAPEAAEMLKQQERQERAKQRWNLALRLTQSDELLKQLKVWLGTAFLVIKSEWILRKTSNSFPSV